MSLTINDLIKSPEWIMEAFTENPVEFSSNLYSQMNEIDPKVLRVILQTLWSNDYDLTKIWNLRQSPDMPEWWGKLPTESYLTCIDFNLPLSPDGNLILWSVIDQPINHDILDALITKGMDINYVNADEKLTLLQKSILLGNENNVRMLLRHGANPGNLIDGLINQSVTGKQLRIIRELKIYGGTVNPTKITGSVRKYLDAAKMLKPDICSRLAISRINMINTLSWTCLVFNELTLLPEFAGVVEAMKNWRNEYALVKGGEVVSWPYFMNESTKISECSSPYQEITVSPLPNDDEIMDMAIKDLPNTNGNLRKLP